MFGARLYHEVGRKVTCAAFAKRVLRLSGMKCWIFRSFCKFLQELTHDNLSFGHNAKNQKASKLHNVAVESPLPHKICNFNILRNCKMHSGFCCVHLQRKRKRCKFDSVSLKKMNGSEHVALLKRSKTGTQK